jgi:GntR family transcriptional regulator of vanillate catabolism
MQKYCMTELQWKSALYQLRRRLVSGELIGGTKLRASHLANEMGISRTPIGEALIKLEGEGLLIRDKSGFTVRTFALEDVFDAIDLRGTLEGAAVQKAAERGVSGPDLEDLNKLLAELDQVIDNGQIAEYDQLNLDFHRRLTQLSRSDILIAEVERSYRLPFAGPSAFPTTESDSIRFRASLMMGQEHHYQIVSALSRREGARVFALMSEHARLAHGNVHAAIREHEQAPQLALVSR